MLQPEQAPTIRVLPSQERPKEGDEEAAERGHRSGVILTMLEHELFQRGTFTADDVDNFVDAHRLDAGHAELVHEVATAFREESERSSVNVQRLKQRLFDGRDDEPSPVEWGNALFQFRVGDDLPVGSIRFERMGPFFSLTFSSSDDFSAFIHGGRRSAPDRSGVRGALRTDMIRFSFFERESVPLLLMNEQVVNAEESDTKKHELQHAIQMVYWDGRNPTLQKFFRGKHHHEESELRRAADDVTRRQHEARDAIKDELLARIRSGNDPVYVLNMLYAKQYADLFPADKSLQMWVQHIREVVKHSVNELRQFMVLFPTADARGVIVNQLMGVALEDFPATLRRMKQYYAGFVATYVREDVMAIRSRDVVYPTRIQQHHTTIDHERQRYLRELGTIVTDAYMKETIDLRDKQEKLRLAEHTHRKRATVLARELKEPFPSADQPQAWLVNDEQFIRTSIDLASVPWAIPAARIVVDVLDAFDRAQLDDLHHTALSGHADHQGGVDDASIPKLKRAIADAVAHTEVQESVQLTEPRVKLFVTDNALIVDCLLRTNARPIIELRVRATYQFTGTADSSFWDEEFL